VSVAATLWRPQFLDALRLLAKISDALAVCGRPRPILVGGGAVEYYSGSAMMTGDIDLVSPIQSEVEAEMQRHGFVKPSGPQMLTRGWIHPGLGLGFEIVGSAPLDGHVDATHIMLINNVFDGASFAVIAVEDLIADRMGQFASGAAPDMRAQARELLALHPSADLDYLERRVRFETAGDYGVGDITG
jgi:hypothetical protein